jgi:hypothetical protein
MDILAARLSAQVDKSLDESFDFIVAAELTRLMRKLKARGKMDLVLVALEEVKKERV